MQVLQLVEAGGSLKHRAQRQSWLACRRPQEAPQGAGNRANLRVVQSKVIWLVRGLTELWLWLPRRPVLQPWFSRRQVLARFVLLSQLLQPLVCQRR